MRAADIMTRTVVTVHPRTSVADAIRLMLGQRISGLPVVENDGKLVGILTEGDLLRRTELGTERQRPGWLEFLRGPSEQAGDYVQTHGRKVENVMTGDVRTASQETTLPDIVALMEKYHVKRIPIVQDFHLVGVVSRADLLRALSTAMVREPATDSSDEAIRAHIATELNKHPWGGREQITVTVTDRIAALDGVVYDIREREALHVLIENTPGVEGLRDYLRYIDPQQDLIYP